MILEALIVFLFTFCAALSSWATKIHDAIESNAPDQPEMFIRAALYATDDELNNKFGAEGYIEGRSALHCALVRTAEEETIVLFSHPRLLWNEAKKNELIGQVASSPTAKTEILTAKFGKMPITPANGLDEKLATLSKQDWKNLKREIIGNDYPNVIETLTSLYETSPRGNRKDRILATAAPEEVRTMRALKELAIKSRSFAILRYLFRISDVDIDGTDDFEKRIIYLASRADSFLVDNAHLSIVLDGLVSTGKSQSSATFLREDNAHMRELRQFITQSNEFAFLRESLRAFQFGTNACQEKDLSKNKTEKCEKALLNAFSEVLNLLRQLPKQPLSPFFRLITSIRFLYRDVNDMALSADEKNMILNFFFLRIVNPLLVEGSVANRANAIMVSRCLQRFLNPNSNSEKALEQLKNFFHGKTKRGKDAHAIVDEIYLLLTNSKSMDDKAS